MLYYIIVAHAPLVRNHAVAAILNAILRIGEIAAAIFDELRAFDHNDHGDNLNYFTY